MYEIIHVVDPKSLSGLASHNLEIEAVDDRPLPPGYYFILWPASKAIRGNPGKHYFGPFSTRAEARLMHRSALAFGLIQEGCGVQSIAECRSIVRPLAAMPLPVRPDRMMAACPA